MKFAARTKYILVSGSITSAPFQPIFKLNPTPNLHFVLLRLRLSPSCLSVPVHVAFLYAQLLDLWVWVLSFQAVKTISKITFCNKEI